jgi:hypothetical protein
MPSPKLELVTVSGDSIANNDQENMEIKLWQSKVSVEQQSVEVPYIFYRNSLTKEHCTMHWADIISFGAAVTLRQ